MAVKDKVGEALSRKQLALSHRYVLVVEHSTLEIRSPERDALWGMLPDLEQLGHRFVKLERLPDGRA